MTRSALEAAIEVSKALADRNRVRMLAACRRAELCVCQLVELLGLAPSTVSKHLSMLRAAGLVTDRKIGRWKYHRLAEAPRPRAVESAFVYLFDGIQDDPIIQADARRLDRLLESYQDMLCQQAGVGAASSSTRGVPGSPGSHQGGQVAEGEA